MGSHMECFDQEYYRIDHQEVTKIDLLAKVEHNVKIYRNR